MNPPVKWLLVFVGVVLFLSFLFAPGKTPVNWSEIDFSTTSDARLYFHNVRSFYYHLDATSKKPMRIYSLRRRTPEDDSLSLQFNIVQHPNNDQAYIYASLGKAFKHIDSASVVFTKGLAKEPFYRLKAENHYRIAAKVYQSLEQENPVYLVHRQDTLANLYDLKQSQINAEITLEDYFKLTHKH